MGQAAPWIIDHHSWRPDFGWHIAEFNWLNQPGAHGVKVDIIDQRSEVFATRLRIDHHGLVALPEQMADNSMPGVITDGVSRLKPGHTTDEIGLGSFNQER